jgi:glycosyltransferase involved in cell wall biosynthesis
MKPHKSESQKRIAVCSIGNPLASSTWSGTPANICRFLNAMGRLHHTVDASDYARPRIQQITTVASRLYYRSVFDPSGRGRFHRYLRARHVNALLKEVHSTDVLHMSTLDLPLAMQRSGVRHYLFCDTTWDLWRALSAAGRLSSKRLLADSERLEQKAYSQMLHIFPISEYVRQNLITHYGIPPERVTAVGTGRGAIKPYDGPKDYENCTILFVAKERFEDKGGSLLVEGFKRAWQRNPRLRLIVVGDERYRESIGNVQNIEVYGFIPFQRLQDLFNRASLFAMPAVNEPWGLVYLEALSCKTPVMGLNRNAFPEITQRGRFGFCLEDATAEAVAEALLDAFRDPDRLARMGAEGQEYCVRNFTWERTVQRIVDTIDGPSVARTREDDEGTALALGQPLESSAVIRKRHVV